MELFIFGGPDVLHLLIIIEMQLVISRLPLPEIYRMVLRQMILLDQFYYLPLLVQLLLRLREVEITSSTTLLRLYDAANRRVQRLCLSECLMRLGITQMHCTSNLVYF
jgi:hypothetical protein